VLDENYEIKYLTNFLLFQLDLLGPKLVVYENTDSGCIVKPILDVPVLIELSYYANNLISHFMHQSLVGQY